MYTMKTITTTINPPYKPRLSWVSFHSTQFRKFRFTWYIKLGQAISVKIVVPSTALLYSAYKAKTKREVVWFGAVQPKCIVPLGTWNVRTFKPLNCSALVLPYMAPQRALTPLPYSLCIDANFFFR